MAVPVITKMEVYPVAGRDCMVGAISQGDGKYDIDANSCIDCGTCAGVCPTGAIEQG